MERSNKKLIEQMKVFDDTFEDGVFVIPSTTKVKVRALSEYCQKKGISVESLSEEEILQFVEKVREEENE
ncbi:hypothetical protein [Oceanobacillus picturae]|uniref:hypothetical protein n=1 Tax=Oceanobacillus picturae TaxID=171693 RepID=UPI00364170EB